MNKLQNLNRRTSSTPEGQGATEERANARFKARVAAQQFLKHHAPLVPVFMRTGGVSELMATPGIFAEKAKLARQLAIEIAARVMEKPIGEITMSDARHFRTEAAELVAFAWDAQIELDLALVADDVAKAVSGADDTYDAETIKWSQMSGLGSATLTAAAAASSLTTAIELYDFRLGHNMVLSTLTSAVLEATREAVEIMLPSDATDEDRRSLTQTTLRSNCSIIRQIYETAAREALSTLHNADEERKKAWLRQNRPLEAIVSKFRNWSHNIATIAAAAARETVNGARSTASDAAPGH